MNDDSAVVWGEWAQLERQAAALDLGGCKLVRARTEDDLRHFGGPFALLRPDSKGVIFAGSVAELRRFLRLAA